MNYHEITKTETDLLSIKGQKYFFFFNFQSFKQLAAI